MTNELLYGSLLSINCRCSREIAWRTLYTYTLPTRATHSRPSRESDHLIIATMQFSPAIVRMNDRVRWRNGNRQSGRPMKRIELVMKLMRRIGDVEITVSLNKRLQLRNCVKDVRVHHLPSTQQRFLLGRLKLSDDFPGSANIRRRNCRSHQESSSEWCHEGVAYLCTGYLNRVVRFWSNFIWKLNTKFWSIQSALKLCRTEVWFILLRCKIAY